MSLMDVLRRRRARTFNNQLSDLSLPTGDLSLPEAELDTPPLQAQQLALLAELLQGVQADQPDMADEAPLPRARQTAMPRPSRLDLTDFEQELVNRPKLPGAPTLGRRPAPVAPRRPAPEGTLLEQMLRDPGSQRMFRAAQREINAAPGNMARDYATAAVGVPIMNRLARAGGPAIDALKQFLRSKGLAPADEMAQVADALAGMGDEAAGQLADLADVGGKATGQLRLPLEGGSVSTMGGQIYPRPMPTVRPSPSMGRGGQLELPFDENLAQLPLPFRGLEDALPTQGGRMAAGVDDALQQLKLKFSSPRSARVKAAVKTPTPATETATVALTPAERKAEGLANLKAAAARAKAKAPTAPSKTPTTPSGEKETTFVELPQGFFKRGGEVQKIPMGVSGLPPKTPKALSPEQQLALNDFKLLNMNAALGAREAGRRAAQRNRVGMAPIIAAILGGQSFRN